MGARITLLVALAVLGGAGLSYLATHDPAKATAFPKCFLHETTGWHCAGCGGTRAAYALLHFDFAGALRNNPLLVVALPFVLAGLAMEGGAWLLRERYRGPRVRLPRRCAWWLPGILVAFWILRNVSIWPFTLLAPE